MEADQAARSEPADYIETYFRDHPLDPARNGTSWGISSREPFALPRPDGSAEVWKPTRALGHGMWMAAPEGGGKRREAFHESEIRAWAIAMGLTRHDRWRDQSQREAILWWNARETGSTVHVGSPYSHFGTRIVMRCEVVERPAGKAGRVAAVLGDLDSITSFMGERVATALRRGDTLIAQADLIWEAGGLPAHCDPTGLAPWSPRIPTEEEAREARLTAIRLRAARELRMPRHGKCLPADAAIARALAILSEAEGVR